MNSRIISSIFRYLKTRPTFESVGIEPYRQLLEKGAAAFKPDASVKMKPFQINHIPAQWIIPPNADEKRTILYIHGGGYIAGSINSHKDLASRIALAAQGKILIFNYSLAPEKPFPAGLNDCKTIYQWLLSQTGPDDRICLGGDSAGGGLALALLAVILEEKMPLPHCSVLISPWIDLECNRSSHVENALKDPMLSPDVLKKTARLYTDKPLTHPLISPIHNTFEGITPVLIQAGENEVLLDDTKYLAQKLRAAEATVELEIWKDMFHVWHYFAKYLSEGQKAIKVIGKFIRQHS